MTESARTTAPFDSVFVDDLVAEHLEAAADAKHRRIRAASTADGVREPAVAKPPEVGHRGLRSRNDDEIRIAELLGRCDPANSHARFGHQRLELVEVGNAREAHHRDVDDDRVISA